SPPRRWPQTWQTPAIIGTTTTCTIGACPTRSAICTITAPACSRVPSPITTVPRPSSAARARRPISARTAAGTPATRLLLLLASPAEPSLIIGRPHALVAQLDRASDFDSEGREFESLRAR